jgi:hypothetical protein
VPENNWELVAQGVAGKLPITGLPARILLSLSARCAGRFVGQGARYPFSVTRLMTVCP